uniref:N-acetyltransferase domain-containing protein n=1 Tax=Oreochromis niloticus TaxID=8128 RepID=A0A669CIV8_ORENI
CYGMLHINRLNKIKLNYKKGNKVKKNMLSDLVVGARAQVVGMVAVVAKHSGTEKYGEMFRMIISPQYRRMGLGFRLTQTAVDFCKEQGFSKVVLETTSTQLAAVALYSKVGFNHVHTMNRYECKEQDVVTKNFLVSSHYTMIR